MRGARRLSQAISEGDGISVLVEVESGAAARAAEAQGADGLAVREAAGGIREASGLPLLFVGAPEQAGEADAVVLDADPAGERLAEAVEQASGLGLEWVVRVRDEDELEHVLERLDPEILLLSAEDADAGQHHLDRLLELLPDVPAGKLAIAELASATRLDVLELERAGVDAVLVTGGDVGPLVGDELPEV